MVFGHNFYMVFRYYFMTGDWKDAISDNIVSLITSTLILILIFVISIIDNAGSETKKLMEKYMLECQKDQANNPDKYKNDDWIKFNDHSTLFAMLKSNKAYSLTLAGWKKLTLWTIALSLINILIKPKIIFYVYDTLVKESGKHGNNTNLNNTYFNVSNVTNSTHY